MALNLEPQSFRTEIESAIALRKRVTDLSAQRIAQEHGSQYIDGLAPDIEPHENHAHDYRSTILPSIAYYNPSVTLKSRRPIVQAGLVEALQMGTNRWIRDVNLVETLRLIGLDMLFDFGVALASLKPVPGNPEARRPEITRLSPRRYFCDPQACGYHTRRFEGHLWVRDADDLIAQRDARGKRMYDERLIRKLTDEAADQVPERARLERLGITITPRRQVVGYEVYVPETNQFLVFGYHNEEGGYLREPRKAFCPPWGPYTLFGVYLVPDQIYPLAPLAVPQSLVEELNAQIDQNTRLADQAGTFHIVNSPNQKLQNVMRRVAPGSIVYLPGFDTSQLAAVTRPGPSREQLDYVDRLRERLDRKSGLTDTQRGEITGKATAYEVATASRSGDKRTRFLQAQFAECSRKVIETAAWYLAYAQTVVFNIPVPPVPTVGKGQNAGSLGGALWREGEELVDGEFVGGIQEGQEDFDWYDLELEIDARSMEMDDDAGSTSMWMNFAQWLAGAAPMMPQTPWVNWPKLVEMTGDRFNVPNASELVNFPLVAQIAGIQGFTGSPPRPDARESLARSAPPEPGAATGSVP